MERKKRIIVTEDDQDMLWMMVDVLTKHGYEVLGMPDGLNIVEGHCQWPDLFLLDKEMDHVDGEEITKFIRGNEASRHIPVVMVSGSNAKASALAAGVDTYISKPFKTHELLSVIDNYLSPMKKAS